MKIFCSSVLVGALFLVSSLGEASESSDEIAQDQSVSLDAGYHFQALGSFVSVNHSAFGAEIGAAALLSALPEHGFFVGPRASVSFTNRTGRGRFELNTGVDSTLWFADSFGVGLAAEVVVPSPRFRAQNYLSFRVHRHESVGVWAFRAGLLYDTRFRWGGFLGISLQFGGVTPSSGSINL